MTELADKVFNEAGLVALLLFFAVVILWRRNVSMEKRLYDLAVSTKEVLTQVVEGLKS